MKTGEPRRILTPGDRKRIGDALEVAAEVYAKEALRMEKLGLPVDAGDFEQRAVDARVLRYKLRVKAR